MLTTILNTSTLAKKAGSSQIRVVNKDEGSVVLGTKDLIVLNGPAELITLHLFKVQYWRQSIN